MNTQKLLEKLQIFHFIAGKKKAEDKLLEKPEVIECLPMNRLHYDLIIYERNPFPEAAFLGFYPMHVEFLEMQETEYAKGITFEGIVERLEQKTKQYLYTIKTKYGHIVVESRDKKKEMGELVKVGIRDEQLYYFDMEENPLVKQIR
mgnify:CR=1 FL=1